MLRSTRSLVPAVLSLALVVAACGGAPDGQVDTAGEPGGRPPSIPLPTLPSVVERHPEAYDAQGCTRLGPEEVDCSATAAGVDRAAAHPDDGWRTLGGFVGPHYATDASAGTVVLLDGTTSTSTAGPWTAAGLVRNDTTGPVTAVSVEVALLDGSGRQIDVARGAVPVDPVRPGEPAPFEITSDVPADQVAEVRWSLAFEPAAGNDERLVELVTWWDRPADDPEPVDLYLYRDEPGAPLPYLLFGAATNHGSVELPTPTVVAAWVDDGGRVVDVAETGVVTDPAAGTGGPPLVPGASADFLFVLDERPPAVDGARVMLWAVRG